MATAFDQVLKLFITADGKGLSAGLQRATGELKNFGSSAQRAFSGVQSAFAALGVSLTAGAFAVGIKRTIDSMDALNDASKRLGVSTEALSALGYAAEQSGSSLEGVQTGLRFLNKNLVEAQEGSKDLASTFRQLGVTATDDTETALLKIADAFAKLPDGAQKTAFAIKVFGRSGAELIPLLNEGSAGIAKFRAEAERLGIIVSGTAAKAADDFNDSVNALGKSVSAVGIAIANDFLPFVGRMAEAMAGAAKSGKGLKGVMDALGTQTGKELFDAFNGLGATQKEIAETTNKLAAAREKIERYKKAAGEGGPFADLASAGAQRATKYAAELEAKLAGLWDRYKRLSAAQTAAADSASEAAEAAKQTRDAIAGTGEAAREAADKIVGLQASYKKLITDLKEGKAESQRTAFKDVKQSSVLDINRLRDQAQAALERGGDDGAEEAKRFLDQAKKINDYLLESGQISKNYYQTQADLLTQLAEQGQQVLDGQPLNLPVAPDLEQAVQAGKLASEAAQSGVKPIVIPGVVQIAGNQFTDQATLPQTADGRTIISAKGFASGGHVRGPGTSLSDSILARLSAGEFVVRAQAVRNYGLGFLERLNSLALPKFATGGPVGTPINLYLPDGRSFGMSAQPSVAAQLGRILGAEVLKRGRR